MGAGVAPVEGAGAGVVGTVAAVAGVVARADLRRELAALLRYLSPAQPEVARG